MMRFIVVLAAILFSATCAISRTDSTQLSVTVLSKEADTPLRGIEVLVIDDSTSSSQSAKTDTIGKATFSVVRGSKVAVYIMRIGILNGAEKVFTVPSEGLMTPIAVSLSKEQIEQAKANLDKQAQSARQIEALKEQLSGSMAFRTVRAFLDTILVDAPLGNETIEFTSIATGKKMSVTSDADGYLFLKGASIGLKENDKFSMTSMHRDSEKIPFQDGSEVMKFDFQPINTGGEWSGQYQYLAVPVPTRRLSGIDLNTNSTSIPLTDALRADLALVADIIKRKNYVVEVQSYTDNTGTDKNEDKRKTANRTLSQKRADEIVKHLTTTYGVNAANLKAIGYGEEFPIADNATEQGRMANRRVVVKVSR